jgi:hypothetical protein
LFLVATYSGKTGRNRDGAENKSREQRNPELPNLAVLSKLEAFTLPLVVGRETIVGSSGIEGSPFKVGQRWPEDGPALDLIDDHQSSPNKRPGTRSNVETPCSMLNSEVFMILVSRQTHQLPWVFFQHFPFVRRVCSSELEMSQRLDGTLKWLAGRVNCFTYCLCIRYTSRIFL